METLQRTANRGSISTGYDIDNSCKFEADNVEKMTHTYNSAPTSQKKGTISMWFKRTEVGSNIGLFQFGDDASGNYLSLRWGRDIYGSLETYGMRIGGTNFSVGNTYGAVRDTSAFYHVVIAIDTTQATSTNRFKVYRNGVEPGWSTDNTSNITQNADLAIGENGKDIIIGEGVYRYNGYIAEVNYVDGQQLAPTDFGEYDDDSGIWIPKKYTGTYGNNGFYLDFKNASNLGEDKSGNNHDFTLSNISSADQATDTPTNNFATLNPLMANAGPANYLPITEGGTKAVNTAAAYKIANSTFGVTSGKWYWEVKATDVNGVTAIGVTMPYYWDTDYTLGGCIYYGQTGQRYNATGASAFGATYTDGDIISFALDMDATPPTMEVYKNNSSQGNLMAGLSIGGTGTAFLPVKEDGYFPKIVGYNANTFECNFGGYTSFSISSAASDDNGYGTFEYSPPSGYYALCTKNLAEYG